MSDVRTEHDLIGSRQIPENALYGIHTQRAVENFQIAGWQIQPSLIHAYGAVKLACAAANRETGYLTEDKFNYIRCSCEEMMEGQLDNLILVDALQGGAGTSTNMNVNEVLTNRSLQMMGYKPGSYDMLHPLDDLNKHQSTNDTYPTALRVAVLNEINTLEAALTELLNGFQEKEALFAHIVKVGRTELQDAVLTTLGRSMSAYAECIGRDRWRISKIRERIRVVNLGGTAIGTGLAAPRSYIFKVVDNLKEITGLNLARAENMVDATQNLDALVETAGMLNTCAANLLKICGDLRLMSSGPSAGLNEIKLPELQSGSTIMPGKVNPVIPEAVSQAAMQVMGNYSIITNAAASGNLELNPFMPLIADRLLESIQLLTNGANQLNKYCIKDLQANENNCRKSVLNSTALVTALMQELGYEKAQKLVENARQTGRTTKDIILENKILSIERFEELTSPESVNSLGFK